MPFIVAGALVLAGAGWRVAIRDDEYSGSWQRYIAAGLMGVGVATLLLPVHFAVFIFAFTCVPIWCYTAYRARKYRTQNNKILKYLNERLRPIDREMSKKKKRKNRKKNKQIKRSIREERNGDTRKYPEHRAPIVVLFVAGAIAFALAVFCFLAYAAIHLNADFTPSPWAAVVGIVLIAGLGVLLRYMPWRHGGLSAFILIAAAAIFCFLIWPTFLDIGKMASDIDHATTDAVAEEEAKKPDLGNITIECAEESLPQDYIQLDAELETANLDYYGPGYLLDSDRQMLHFVVSALSEEDIELLTVALQNKDEYPQIAGVILDIEPTSDVLVNVYEAVQPPDTDCMTTGHQEMVDLLVIALGEDRLSNLITDYFVSDAD